MPHSGLIWTSEALERFKKVLNLMEQKINWAYTDGPGQLQDGRERGIRTEEIRGKRQIRSNRRADILHMTSFFLAAFSFS